MVVKQRYHHIYIEITNICNLNCSFCPKHHRPLQSMSEEVFQQIMDQVCHLTDLVYFHVMGEPLLHPLLRSFIRYANQKGVSVALTTNGLLLPEHTALFEHADIRRINVSLHSYYDRQNLVAADTLDKVMKAVDAILPQCEATMYYRLWNIEDPHARQMIRLLCEHYDTSIPVEALPTSCNGVALRHRVRLQMEQLFEWPVQAQRADEAGFCHGLRSHFAILVNGDVVPCCLDNEGHMRLGNCLAEPLTDILRSEAAQAIYNGFSSRRTVTDLCRQCSYKRRFEKKSQTGI